MLKLASMGIFSAFAFRPALVVHSSYRCVLRHISTFDNFPDQKNFFEVSGMNGVGCL